MYFCIAPPSIVDRGRIKKQISLFFGAPERNNWAETNAKVERYGTLNQHPWQQQLVN